MPMINNLVHFPPISTKEIEFVVPPTASPHGSSRNLNMVTPVGCQTSANQVHSTVLTYYSTLKQGWKRTSKLGTRKLDHYSSNGRVLMANFPCPQRVVSFCPLKFEASSCPCTTCTFLTPYLRSPSSLPTTPLPAVLPPPLPGWPAAGTGQPQPATSSTRDGACFRRPSRRHRQSRPRTTPPGPRRRHQGRRAGVYYNIQKSGGGHVLNLFSSSSCTHV